MPNKTTIIRIIGALILGVVTVFALSPLDLSVQKQQRCLVDSLMLYWNNPGFQSAHYNRCMRSGQQ